MDSVHTVGPGGFGAYRADRNAGRRDHEWQLARNLNRVNEFIITEFWNRLDVVGGSLEIAERFLGEARPCDFRWPSRPFGKGHVNSEGVVERRPFLPTRRQRQVDLPGLTSLLRVSDNYFCRCRRLDLIEFVVRKPPKQ